MGQLGGLGTDMVKAVAYLLPFAIGDAVHHREEPAVVVIPIVSHYVELRPSLCNQFHSLRTGLSPCWISWATADGSDNPPSAVSDRNAAGEGNQFRGAEEGLMTLTFR